MKEIDNLIGSIGRTIAIKNIKKIIDDQIELGYTKMEIKLMFKGYLEKEGISENMHLYYYWVDEHFRELKKK